ncbi:cysteine-rich repeat secretory protein 38-like [Lactuca sativa]|uniref:cysteine-rich repeat secretory protein 38 n=1 Tax=Lactuca sativa TaxID=4236 RepID=UPI000CD99983|nr:cysteine-rich repeat secretory protein 38 [Lactuca sativa]XP_052623306.1 cysteine-rich repeat secretory protein 38-like [Lactuca sativa]
MFLGFSLFPINRACITYNIKTHPSSNKMSSSNHIFIVCVLLFLHFVQMVIGDAPLYHICSTTSGNFTRYSPYEHSLNKLMGELYYKTSPNGFGMGSMGQYEAHTSGLSLCRGDVSQKDCMTCVVNASAEIRRRCPSNKAGIIWYDQCLLKYSSNDFLGQIDNQNRLYMWNLNNVSDPSSFNAETKRLLSGLSNTAYNDPKMYAAGALDLDGLQKLYGLVQCTRDLSSVDCKTCLDGAISELPSCCDGKRGGRVLGASCNIRYEIYPFVGV